MKRYDTNDPAIVWEPIPDGEDPFFRKGHHPDGWSVHIPRRGPTPEEQVEIDRLVAYNQSLPPEDTPPEVIERLKKIVEELEIE